MNVEDFRAAITAAGLVPPAVIEADGKLHRFGGGWYILLDGAVPKGAFGGRCGYVSVSETWRAKKMGALQERRGNVVPFRQHGRGGA